jgi:hypothetical protein
MEHGPIKRYYTRWLNIIIFCLIGIFGLDLLYLAFFVTDSQTVQQLRSLMFFVGPVLFLFGVGSAFGHWRSGYAFYRKSKVFPEDATLWKEVDNGLVIITHNWAKHIFVDAKKVKERGYIKMTTQYNRKKEIVDWTLLGY